MSIEEHYEQTKALGKGLRVYELGDRVSVYPAPMTWAELDAFDAGTIAPVDVDDFQVELWEGWAIALDHVLVAWRAEPVDGLATFDYLGRPLPWTPFT